MAPEVFVLIVKERQLQRIDHAAHSVDDAAGQEPAERCGGHVVEYLRESQYAGPAHPDIKYRGYPFRAVDPECLDQDACDRDRPHNGQEDDPSLSFQDDEADRGIAAGDEHGDHHVVDLFQDCVYFRRDIKCMISRTCRV